MSKIIDENYINESVNEKIKEKEKLNCDLSKTSSFTSDDRKDDNERDDNEKDDNESDNEEFKDCVSDSPQENEMPSHDEIVNDNNKSSDNCDEYNTDDEYAKEMESHLSAEELNVRRNEAIDAKNEGNELFKEKLFNKSIERYTYAVRHCPIVFNTDRSVMYSNRAAAYIHLDLKSKAINDCSKAIQLNDTYLKAILRRAQLLRESDDKLDDALNDYKRVLELDPDCTEARVACAQLPQQINSRNERLKDEMMMKLKDLGNLVLRPFGLSTDNFKMTQNPDTGGYSVNFQNN